MKIRNMVAAAVRPWFAVRRSLKSRGTTIDVCVGAFRASAYNGRDERRIAVGDAIRFTALTSNRDHRATLVVAENEFGVECSDDHLALTLRVGSATCASAVMIGDLCWRGPAWAPADFERRIGDLGVQFVCAETQRRAYDAWKASSEATNAVASGAVS